MEGKKEGEKEIRLFKKVVWDEIRMQAREDDKGRMCWRNGEGKVMENEESE